MKIEYFANWRNPHDRDTMGYCVRIRGPPSENEEENPNFVGIFRVGFDPFGQGEGYLHRFIKSNLKRFGEFRLYKENAYFFDDPDPNSFCACFASRMVIMPESYKFLRYRPDLYDPKDEAILEELIKCPPKAIVEIYANPPDGWDFRLKGHDDDWDGY